MREKEGKKKTLDNINDLSIALKNVDNLRRLLIPDEEVSGVTAADDIFVLQSEEVDVLDSLHVAMATVLTRVR